MDFIRFLDIDWPKGGTFLFTVRVADVQSYRDHLVAIGRAPKTVVHRVSAVSGFYTYMREAAIEHRLPINIPNPAHSQFVSRDNADPVEETAYLTLAHARRLRSLPETEELLDYRDRAIIDFYLYSGARLATGCRLTVKDFRWDVEDPKVRINEKGNRRRTIGLHPNAAKTMKAYIEKAELTRGALFRPRLNSRSQKLGTGHMCVTTMYNVLQAYLEKLPGAMREVEDEYGDAVIQCVYSPHSLRATTATLLLDAGEDIRKVQELLGHKHVTTTQIYDKRRRTSRESASHAVPI